MAADDTRRDVADHVRAAERVLKAIRWRAENTCILPADLDELSDAELAAALLMHTTLIVAAASRAA